MAEIADQESKTEEPTEKKIRDSLDMGKIPVSREMSVFASMAALMIVQMFLLPESVTKLAFALRRLIDSPEGFRIINGADAIDLLGAVAIDVSRFMLPIILILATFGLAASVLQNVPRLVFNRIQPDLGRLSITQGWKRLFGIQGRVEFGKSLFKFIAVTLVVMISLRSAEANALGSMLNDPVALPELILTIAMRLVSAICIGTILLVAMDLAWARFQWRRELRMTKQELKDEFKQIEGDPLVKARLRSLQRDRSRRRMIAAAARASLVIANPTHYAIALRYQRDEDRAPLVLAKGKDAIALKIRAVAEQNNIPVVEDKALARSLYEAVQVDYMIPPEFFRPVAEIIFFLQSQKAPTSTPIR